LEAKMSKEVYEALSKIGEIAAENQRKLKKIAEGDDWSFVLKCMAIVESALDRLLASKTKDPKFESIFSKMSISSKLNMADDLGFFTSKKERGLLEYLISLRNRLAHDPEEIDFSFKNYFDTMTSDERNKFRSCMKIDDEEKDDGYYGFIYSHPKDGIWILVNTILSVFAFRQEFNKVTNWIDETSLVGGRSLLSELIDRQMDESKMA